jgi:hypothetical protein
MARTLSPTQQVLREESRSVVWRPDPSCCLVAVSSRGDRVLFPLGMLARDRFIKEARVRRQELEDSECE